MKESSLLEQVTEAFRCLPGVGPKSAQRMLLHLLERDRGGGNRLAALITEAMQKIGHCQKCRNLSEADVCKLCLDPSRDPTMVCVVESPADVIAIEQSASYRGQYFVLMGTLSPIDGRGPEELGIEQLIGRCTTETHEVILAISSSVEGEATSHYISEALKVEKPAVTVSKIAQGIPLGGELEYVDGGTLTHALQGRKSI